MNSMSRLILNAELVRLDADISTRQKNIKELDNVLANSKASLKTIEYQRASIYDDLYKAGDFQVINA